VCAVQSTKCQHSDWPGARGLLHVCPRFEKNWLVQGLHHTCFPLPSASVNIYGPHPCTTNQPLHPSPPQPANLAPLFHGQNRTACPVNPHRSRTTKRSRAPTFSAYNTTPIPFWNIFFIFNHLLSHKKDPSTQLIATLLPSRIAKLGQGQIRELCDQAFAFPELSPDSPSNAITDDNAPPSFDNATLFCPEAQAAANGDNLHTACQRMPSSPPGQTPPTRD
jgi:hypothetical protein